MTRAVRDRVLKDANGNIGDHLRSHIHLTNCIHLKNHMHKHSPVLADRSLMRDLAALQRSRSLRDPSMSPPSWQSPSVVDVLLRRGERDSGISNGRRSVGIDRPRDEKGILGRSSIVSNDEVVAVRERSNDTGERERRRVNREVSHGGDHELSGVGDGSMRDNVSGNSGEKDRNNQQKGRLRQVDHLKTLSEQLNDIPIESDGAASSHNHVHGIHARNHRFPEEAEANIRGQRSTRGRRRKMRAARKSRASVSGGQNEMSVASNSFAQGGGHRKYEIEEGDEERADQNVTRGPTNGCGIPWNWSRIHHRGKSFLDIAGKSLSCGLSDSRLRKGSLLPRGRDIPDTPAFSDYSNSTTKSDGEALPLLLDASGSQRSTDNAAWVHDYSGELGIFADNLLKHEDDSDLVSEARSNEQHKRVNRHGRHQSITQKYMPRTFRDLVGQHLVAQALSNAVVRRKIGLLYVFYGPHGTGKTSTARIFSRALNCQSQDHPKPCGVCNSCIAYSKGKIRNIKEVGSVSSFDFEGIIDLLENMIVPQLSSHYRVLIFDDCNTLSPDSWSAIVKVIDRSPRRVVFILVCSTLDVLPHIIISRCQKFFFPKLKDADIIYALQWIATNEDLDIDKDALKLIASKSDGSLRDAEMTLEQLSLLGQRISVPLVQEMVGLISDEKLVDLLDFALSADTVNTVKNLREIMESGVEPLALMSQLATVITDVLAGGYNFTKRGHRRKFFRQQALSKEDMEKLRQALKTLSEAEKQLRMSNDRLTWLTAALLQLAPDQQYMLPNSSAEISCNHSPLGLNNTGAKQKPRKSNVEHTDMPNSEKGFSAKVRIESQSGKYGNAYYNAKMNVNCIDRPHQVNILSDRNRLSNRQLPVEYRGEIEEIWLDVLEQIRINNIREFLYQEGKLISVSYGAAPTVQLVFSSHLTKSTAERFKTHILQAFESVLGSPLTIEIRCESSKDYRQESRSEIVEIEASPRERKSNVAIEDTKQLNIQNMRSSSMASFPDQRKLSENNRSLSLVKSKVSLGHVIQQAEASTQQNGWSKEKAVSIAEKLEQENLRLEPKSRSLLCWKASKLSRKKVLHWKIRTKKPQRLLRFVSCGRCLSSRSPK